MNRIVKSAGFLLLIFILSACTRDQCNLERTYLKYEPVYMSYDEFFRDAVEAEAPRPLKNPGKIYFKDNLILVNELQQGIHIIDNTSSSNPVNIGFINIPGNVDMAIKGNVLYADSYIDLVAIDISDLSNPRELSRVEEVFQYISFQHGVSLNPDLGVVKEWKSEMVTEPFVGDCNRANRNGNNPWMPGMNPGVDDLNTFGGTNGTNATGGNNNKAIPSQGIAGSMARFSLYTDYLYVVTQEELMLFDVSNPGFPASMQKINVGWGVETIFPYENMLYIGAQGGMHIYDNTNPMSPQFVSTYEHITSCDPVVVSDDKAYVTLRNGTPCWGFVNQLEIIDVSDPSSPELIATHDMHNPHGLGIDMSTLFLCDGDAGLKVFDVSDPENLGDIAHFADINTYDVIPLTNRDVLLMVGADGFYQYDYSDVNNVSLLSVIQVEGE